MKYLTGQFDTKLKQPGSRLLGTAIKRIKEFHMASTTASKSNHKPKDEKSTKAPTEQKSEKQLQDDRDKIIHNPRLSEQEKSAELGRQPLREALEGKGVDLTFPTQDTWMIYKNGKSDSGSMTVPINTIVERADRL